MSEMIERIDQKLTVLLVSYHDLLESDRATKDARDAMRRAFIREAIAAMREPTEAMLRPNGDDLAYFDFHRRDDAAGIWRAMIDEAAEISDVSDR